MLLASLVIERGEVEGGERILQRVCDAHPSYEPARNLLAELRQKLYAPD